MKQDKPFLEELAHRYLKEAEAGVAPDVVVFPNRRALTVFRRLLSGTSGRAMLFPSFETIESYAANVSGFKQLSKREMLVPLFHLCKEAGRQEGFDHFLQWAPTLIDDFNDIDDYLANGTELFQHLSEARAIEMWNPGKLSLSDFQKRFLEFWKSLPDLYARLKIYNETARCGTAGQVKRKAAEVLEKRDGFIGKRTWFAGFNALTPSEAALIEILSVRGKVKIFWDAGRYYYGMTDHEAGKYIRHYHMKWYESGISELVLHHGWNNPEKKIRMTGAPGLSGQALAAAEALLEMRQKHSDKRIALIASGMQAEQALAHLLPDGEQINFSPGLPFSSTPAAVFLQLAWELWLKRDAHKGFSSPELCALLRNPLAAEMGGSAAGDLLDMLNESGKPFAGKQDFEDCPELPFFSWLHSFMYGPRELTRAWVQKIRQLLFTYFTEIYSKIPYDKRSISTGLAITALDQFLAESEGLPEEELDPFLGKRWMTQSIRDLKIPVEGKPEAMVQVMGLLESRNMDFDVVILVGANEGQLPAPAQPSSFIPFDIRNIFHLPGRSDRESVFAYHFYRTLQHPQEVVLIYNTEIDSFGSGEKSRYLQQLEFEWPKHIKGANIDHEVRKSVPVKEEERKVSGIKNERSLKAIRDLMDYGLSPTALNSYRTCQLQFYLRYILRLQEAAEQNSILGADTLGSGLHYAFEEIYGGDQGKPLQIKTLEKAKAEADRHVEEGIKKAFAHADLNGGKNLLLKKMSETLVRKVLDFDIERIRSGQIISIVSLEEKLTAEIKVGDTIVRFRGKADRIEKSGDRLLIIDYKTGKAESSELKLKTVQVFELEPREKAFQLMMYSWMYGKGHQNKFADSGILSVRKPSAGVLRLVIEEEKEMFADFEKYLSTLAEELLHPQKEFKQTDDLSRCTYCEFSRLCARV